MTAKRPLVSVLMPVYRGERYLAEAIQSVLGQTHENLELIVVDDGSPDGSAEIVAGFREDARVRYVEQENQGVAAARNTGLGLATGKYVGFCDQDDWWLPRKLESQVGFLEAHPDVALVHGRIEYIDSAGAVMPPPDGRMWFGEAAGACFGRLFMGNRIAVVSALVRADAITAVGPFKAHRPGVDDYDLWLRIARRFALGFQDEVVAHYRWHDTNEALKWWRQTERTAALLEEHLESDPAIWRDLGKAAVNARLAGLYLDLARYYQRQGPAEEARRVWRKVLSNRAGCWECYWGIAVGYVPTQYRTALAWYGKKLKRLLGNAP